jgi:hypothetical protein
MSFNKNEYQKEYMKNRRSGGKTKLQLLQEELETNKQEIVKLKSMLESNNQVIEGLRFSLESNKSNDGLIKTATQMKDGRILIRLPAEYANKKIRISIVD